MIKVTVKNLNQEITHVSSWSSQEEAEQWFSQGESHSWFGKPERWVLEDEEDISSALDTRQAVLLPENEIINEETGEITIVPAETITEYKLPAQYSVEYEDISAQLEQEQVNEESLKYLADTDWYILREADEGTPCPSDIKAARALARTRIVR